MQWVEVEEEREARKRKCQKGFKSVQKVKVVKSVQKVKVVK